MKTVCIYHSTEAKQIYKKAFPIEFRNTKLTIGDKFTTDFDNKVYTVTNITIGNNGYLYWTGDTYVQDGNINEIPEDSKGFNKFKYKFLCVNQERFNPINFGIDYHKDGYDGFACFWYKDGKWAFSLYNDNGEVDCSTIAKQYGGGGHAGASGFVVSDLSSILK